MTRPARARISRDRSRAASANCPPYKELSRTACAIPRLRPGTAFAGMSGEGGAVAARDGRMNGWNRLAVIVTHRVVLAGGNLRQLRHVEALDRAGHAPVGLDGPHLRVRTTRRAVRPHFGAPDRRTSCPPAPALQALLAAPSPAPQAAHGQRCMCGGSGRTGGWVWGRGAQPFRCSVRPHFNGLPSDTLCPSSPPTHPPPHTPHPAPPRPAQAHHRSLPVAPLPI